MNSRASDEAIVSPVASAPATRTAAAPSDGHISAPPPYLQNGSYVEEADLEFLPGGLFREHHVYLVPKLRALSPGPGGEGIILRFGIPESNHDEPIQLDEEHRTLVAWLPLGIVLLSFASGLDGLVQVAVLHGVVDQRSIHLLFVSSSKAPNMSLSPNMSLYE